MSGTKTTRSAAKVSTGRKSKPSTAAHISKTTAKKATKKAATATSVDQTTDYAAINNVRMTFINLALNMGWRMAIAIMVPTFIGYELDRHYHTAPSYALAGLFLGVFLAALVIADTVKGLNTSQPKEKHRV